MFINPPTPPSPLVYCRYKAIKIYIFPGVRAKTEGKCPTFEIVQKTKKKGLMSYTFPRLSSLFILFQKELKYKVFRKSSWRDRENVPSIH